MFERFTDGLRAAMRAAQEEARRYGHEYVGTEHILLGLLRDTDTFRKWLLVLGGDPEALRAAMEAALVACDWVTQGDQLPQTPSAKRAVLHAVDAGRQYAQGWYVGSHHMLLGLLLTEDCPAAHVLRNCGRLTIERTRADVERYDRALLGQQQTE